MKKKRKTQKRKKKTGEFVKGHIRKMADGSPVKVKGYRRRVFKSRKVVPLGTKLEVQYYQDPRSGRIVPKRKVKTYNV